MKLMFVHNTGRLGSEWVLVGVAYNSQRGSSERVRDKMVLKSGTDTQGTFVSIRVYNRESESVALVAHPCDKYVTVILSTRLQTTARTPSSRRVARAVCSISHARNVYVRMARATQVRACCLGTALCGIPRMILWACYLTQGCASLVPRPLPVFQSYEEVLGHWTVYHTS